MYLNLDDIQISVEKLVSAGFEEKILGHNMQNDFHYSIMTSAMRGFL